MILEEYENIKKFANDKKYILRFIFYAIICKKKYKKCVIYNKSRNKQ